MIRKILLFTPLLILCVLLTPTVTVSALSNRTPSASEGDAKDPNNNDWAASHIMRVHGSGSITTMKFKAYFDSESSASQRQLIIERAKTAGGSTVGRSCNNDNKKSVKLRVRINGAQVGNRSLCSAYYSYNIPNVLTKNDNTGKYEATITLEMNGNRGWSNPSNGEAVFHYVARVTHNNGIIGPTGNAAEDEFGFIGGPDPNYGIQYRIQFGLACNTGSVNNYPVTVWDPENNKFGPTYMWIEKNPPGSAGWTKLNQSEYGSGQVRVSWDTGNGRYVSTADSSEAKSVLKVGTALSGTGYRLVIRNTNVNGYSNGANANVYSITTPSEAIYGQIDCKYTLDPSIGAINDGIDPGATLPISAPVSNNGDINSGDTEWRVTRVEYPSSVPLVDINNKRIGDANGYSDSGPCAAVASFRSYSGGSCDNAWHYVKPKIFASGVNPFTKDYSVPNKPGTRVCFINSVSRPKSDLETSTVWRHSVMRCTIIAKRPKVQILGSDLRVNGLIGASYSENIAGKTYGSWMEYAALSTGLNSAASSGSGLRDGYASSPSKAPWSTLTFSNNNPSTLGSYSPIRASNASGYFGGLTADATSTDTGFDISGKNGVYRFTGTGSLNITASSEVTAAHTVIVIAPDRTVQLGDVSIANSYTSTKDISQVVVLARDINIRASVSKIDAWLIGTESVNTCSDKPSAGLTVSDCAGQLVVNGPVNTKKLYLYRTHGAEAATPGVAAEVFNLRASTYVWAYNYANKQDRAQTVYTTELPPRL